MDRSFLIGGPGKITHGSTVIYSQGDIVVDPALDMRAVNSSLHGEYDSAIIGAAMAINFTPLSMWNAAYRGVLFPSALIAPPHMGARLMGNTDTPTTIDSADDGKRYTFFNTGITQMPEIFAGVGSELYGAATLTALRKNNTVMGDADSLMTITATTWDGSDFPAATFDQAKSTAAFGSVTGMTAMNAQEGWRLQHELNLSPVVWDGETIDFKLRGYRAIARGIPVQPTAEQILGQLQLQAINAGTRMSANANDLAITATGFGATVKSAAITEASYLFGAEPLRNGEIAFANKGATTQRLVLT